MENSKWKCFPGVGERQVDEERIDRRAKRIWMRRGCLSNFIVIFSNLLNEDVLSTFLLSSSIFCILFIFRTDVLGGNWKLKGNYESVLFFFFCIEIYILDGNLSLFVKPVECMWILLWSKQQCYVSEVYLNWFRTSLLSSTWKGSSFEHFSSTIPFSQSKLYYFDIQRASYMFHMTDLKSLTI